MAGGGGRPPPGDAILARHIASARIERCSCVWTLARAEA